MLRTYPLRTLALHGVMTPDASQWQVEQCDDVQPPQPEDPVEVTVFPPLEKPNRETHFRTFLLLHLSHAGNGELELGKSVSKL